ncbi:hypothetical protein A9264_11945 [Vibrio sp. UCD-FRSSP16_10]|uniref:hypothetical protein n=1 Tax=unclassified Vibrio TaxID=2614977 RepID=UPI00080217E7|nr:MULTISPECIES: hypothetical protein [unclassified Vibrio]OBT16345.1 hypothetical protein A9260_12155 [Vibrio sp. UCD-FRSSP16_30]OBT21210.1 hypothetical protein A9264_11945 [Vibrio sp. UCD-FRSSP16_10]
MRCERGFINGLKQGMSLLFIALTVLLLAEYFLHGLNQSIVAFGYVDELIGGIPVGIHIE